MSKISKNFLLKGSNEMQMLMDQEEFFQQYVIRRKKSKEIGDIIYGVFLYQDFSLKP